MLLIVMFMSRAHLLILPLISSQMAVVFSVDWNMPHILVTPLLPPTPLNPFNVARKYLP